MKKALHYIFPLLLLVACGDIIDNKLTLNEHYFIDAIDDDKNRTLYYSLADGGGIGRVHNGIVAFGLNETHIIIKQNIGTVDQYFILDMTKDSATEEPDEVVYGPYSANQFADARYNLNVKETLTFSHKF